MQATRSDQRLEEKFGEVGEAVRVNANLSDHLAEIFSIIFKDPQQTQIKDPKERAIAVFLFMSRSQFFFDANKRTASVMMNGCLMRDGYFPITVMNRDAEEFHEKLRNFYETGDANDMMKFFQKQTSTMYPPQN